MNDDLSWGTLSDLEKYYPYVKQKQFISYGYNNEIIDFYLGAGDSIRKTYRKITYIENRPNFRGWTFNEALVNAIKEFAKRHINIDKLIEKL